MVKPFVKTQREDFDIDTEIRRLTGSDKNIGAVVTFSGLCRDEDGALSALELEHYPGMAEAEIGRIAEHAVDRFELNGITAIHRYGEIRPGENIVLVIAASRHRKAAFEGASYLMDFLKSRAPFWKKEHGSDGKAGNWVDAKETDHDALEKWLEN
ncbi:MAG: molybdenum cofactor biosynthesis protein MoaE [Rhizobiaceae bacterium]